MRFLKKNCFHITIVALSSIRSCIHVGCIYVLSMLVVYVHAVYAWCWSWLHLFLLVKVDEVLGNGLSRGPKNVA